MGGVPALSGLIISGVGTPRKKDTQIPHKITHGEKGPVAAGGRRRKAFILAAAQRE